MQLAGARELSEGGAPPIERLTSEGAAQMRIRLWQALATTADARLPPVFLPGAVDTLGLNMGDVCEIFSHLPGDPEVKRQPYLRTYVDGQMIPALERKIWQTPICANQPFDAWFNRIFEHRRSGLIVNGAERWGLSASHKLARWLMPRLETEDPLRFCLQIILFAGDYGFTPFGVHRDEPCASVLHFNLGPHAKDVYIFERETNQRSPPNIRDATRYCIQPGDGFVLPANYAHIGDAAKFSVDLSCKLMFRSDEATVPLVAASLFEEPQGTRDDTLQEVLLKRLGAKNPREPVGATVENLIATARCRARSNALFVGAPIAASANWSEHSMLSTDVGFPMIVHGNDERASLFSRGKSISIANDLGLQTALRNLSERGHARVSELIGHDDPALSARAIVDFLVTSRGVTAS